MRYRSFRQSSGCPAFLSRPASPGTASASAPAPASWWPTWSLATRPWSIRRRSGYPGLPTDRTHGRTRSRARSVDGAELLDAQAVANTLRQLVGVIADANRVLVAGRALPHVGLALGCRREIIDQQFDLVVIGIVVVHRCCHAVIDATVRANAELLEPLVIADQIGKPAKCKRDVIEACRIRLPLLERPRIEKGHPVVFVIITDERDALGLVKYLGAEHCAVPIDHLAPAIGLQNDVRQFCR